MPPVLLHPFQRWRESPREPLHSIPHTLSLFTAICFAPTGTWFFCLQSQEAPDISHPPVSFHQKALSFPFPLSLFHHSPTSENFSWALRTLPSTSSKSPCILSLFYKCSFHVLGGKWGEGWFALPCSFQTILPYLLKTPQALNLIYHIILFITFFSFLFLFV